MGERGRRQAAAFIIHIDFADFHDNYYVACGGRPLNLPLKEFLIVSRLARNVGRLVLSEEIWRSAWGAHAPFNAQSLHVHIYRLRQRLAPHGLHIETKVCVGYCLKTVTAEEL